HLPINQDLKEDNNYLCTCQNCGHHFKFRAVGNMKSSITFSVNGKSYTVGNEYDPATSLLEFLRKTGISVGTKGCCFEGGCGVCLVTVKIIDPVTGNDRTFSINSCCLQLYTCDGLEVTTVEGLGNTSVGLHPIQDRIAKYNGVQCGYCTPGQVMNMYGLLQNNPRPTKKEIEDAFDSTICRCTGYRPILDAMKSFAVDSDIKDVIDIEELEGKVCKKTGQACKGSCKSEKHVGCGQKAVQAERPVHIVGDRSQWFKPLTLTELLTQIKQYSNSNYRLVFGNTGFGVYGEVGPWNYSILIDLRGVKELYSFDVSPTDHITLGSNWTLTNVKEFLAKNTDPSLPYAQTFVDHLNLTASNSIRNLGTWAGNLALKHLHPEFPSDVFTMFETVGAKLNIDAINTLSGELVPDSSPLTASATYRKSLAIGHFYKFVLGLCKSKCNVKYVSGGPNLDRPLMTSSQQFGTDDPSVYPATKPLIKFIAGNLTSGEAKFVSDTPILNNQLYAAPVLSTQGNAKIQSIDPSVALQIPGVVRFIQASDIPGENNWRPKQLNEPGAVQELLSSSQILYAGQPIGILVAEDEVTARSALYGVQVSYTDIQPAITSLEEAIQKKSFFKKLDTITKGDAATDIMRYINTGAMAAAPHRVSGTVHSTDQYNFHLENQAAFCIPSDTGGMEVITTTQWQDGTSETVSQTYKPPLPKDLPIKFNVKFMRNAPNPMGILRSKAVGEVPVAQGTCPMLALKRAVEAARLEVGSEGWFQFSKYLDIFDLTKFLLAAWSCSMHAVQSFCPLDGPYIGFDDNGKILAIIASAYSDAGPVFINADGNEYTQLWIDSAYFCPNWSWSVQPCKTNKPVATSVRAPGSAPAIFAMENFIDHVATYLKKDHLEVRKVNLFQEGQTTLNGMVLNNCLIGSLVAQLESDINYAARLKAVNDFNQANRWKKRGLHVMPSRYSLGWKGMPHSALVVIHHGDASVSIGHSGIDMGQGINTKAIQVCAYKFGIPMEKIKIKKTNSFVSANTAWTAGTVSSELICAAIMECCDTLLARMAPVKAKLVNPTWEEIVTQCFKDTVDLTASYLNTTNDKSKAYDYNCWCASCSEVELDVLTGQYQITQVDFLYDCGISLNPELDLGQLEGGFLLGCGLFLLEGMTFDSLTGRALTDGTWVGIRFRNYNIKACLLV
uniref:FAD-binding PCMH-type domain-containing protein n=1 Tax=Biomphalaria glabrata TaxID=6526 RepID=A0A2C9JDL4_BIOGL